MNVALGVVFHEDHVITSLDQIGADNQVIVISGTTAETYLEQNEPDADVSVGDSSTGVFYQCTGDCCKYYLLIKRNQCVFSNQSDGSDVYCKGSDWTIL